MSYKIREITMARHNYTDDNIKEAEFLLGLYKERRQAQDQQYNALQTKITFLFGFTATALTLYGTYGAHVNPILRLLTLLALSASLVLLCIAFALRKFHEPGKPDTTIGVSSYSNKLYEELVDIESAYDKSEEPLKPIETWLMIAMYTFTIGVVFLAASFVLYVPNVVNSTHEQCTIKYTHTASKTSAETDETTSKVCINSTNS